MHKNWPGRNPGPTYNIRKLKYKKSSKGDIILTSPQFFETLR